MRRRLFSVLLFVLGLLWWEAWSALAMSVSPTDVLEGEALEIGAEAQEFGPGLCLDPCTGSSCLRRLRVTINGHTVPYYSNYSLDAGNPCITRAVIVVHGSGRNALSAFNSVMSPAGSEGVSTRTLVVAPFFQTSDDGPAASDFYWSEGGWKQGDPSENSGLQPSSFSVMDAFVSRATGSRFANLDALVVTGHSAGGQFVQRYAVGTTIDSRLRPEIFVRFVPANPGSYLYLNAKRPSIADPSVFSTPSGCSSYNRYKYGMAHRNAYMARRSAGDMIASYRARHVVYFVGDRDIVRDHREGNDFDDSCAAMAQGLARYYRGVGYSYFMEEFYEPHAHVLVVAPGIGHSGTAMYASPQGRSLLFD
jgi:hypothetical protein